MKSSDDQVSRKSPTDGELEPDDSKRKYLLSVVGEFVDKYILNYRTRVLLGVCAYISTGSKPPLNSEYAPNSEMDNLIWVGIN